MNTEQSLLDLFDRACAKYADKPAFACLGKTLTYRELDQYGSALCAYLQHHTALQPGDRIAIQLPNLLQYPVAVLGALRAGLVIVNTNPLYTQRELNHQFSDAGVKGAIVLNGLEEGVRSAVSADALEILITTAPTDLHLSIDSETHPREELATPVITLREVLHQGSRLTATPARLRSSDIAVLQYTGGTTGLAKGAMLSHGNLLANVAQVTEVAADSFRECDEIYVSPLPLYHIYAFNLNCLSLVSRGGLSLLIPNPRDLDALVAAIKDIPFTGFVGINTLFTALCRSPHFRELDFSHLRSTSAGGMALCSSVANEWENLTGIEIGEGYGMTETSPVIATNPRPAIQLGTVGVPLPDTDVKVVDSNNCTLPPGSRGELCVRGPQVMQGYWQRPEATAEIIDEDGWLHTGDIAVIQDDGYIRLVDRLKDLIVVSGFNVYPHEVEEVATSHSSVLECAAISVPDEKTGEAVKLFVVPSNGTLDINELKNYLRENLTAYKVPTQFESRSDLPKSNVGKILRRELR